MKQKQHLDVSTYQRECGFASENVNQVNKQANRQPTRNNQRNTQRNNQSRPQQSRQQSNVKKQSNNQQRGQQKNTQNHSQQTVRQQPPRVAVQQRAAQVTQQPAQSPIQARPKIQNPQVPTQRLNISSNRDAILGRTNQDTSVKNLYAYGNTTRCKPKVNEDAYYVGTIEHFVVMIVADGNGTKEGMVNPGNMAVTLMIDYLNTAINKDTHIEEVQKILDNAFYMISRCFISVGAIGADYQNIYACMSVALIDNISSCMVFGNVGNGEIHLLRNQTFTLLNKVHSEAYDAFEANSQGELWNSEYWRTNMKRGIVTSALGVFDKPKADIQLVQLTKDDIIIMVTDGLMYLTGPIGIAEVLAEFTDDMNKGVDKVLQKAEAYECPDNCTLLCAYIITDNGMTLTKAKEKEFQNNSLKTTFDTMVNQPVTQDIQRAKQREILETSATMANPYIQVPNTPRNDVPSQRISVPDTVESKNATSSDFDPNFNPYLAMNTTDNNSETPDKNEDVYNVYDPYSY